MNSITAVGYYPLQEKKSLSSTPQSAVEPVSSRYESPCTSTVHGRIHQVHALSQRLKCFNSSEVLLAILLADLNNLITQRTPDPSGLSYLSGLVLAGMMARQVGTIPISNYRPVPSEQISPIGSRLDVRV